ncbi:glutaredoxin [Lichtheimia hyalospora FSU 10163]|nr:glutaredoxin [Lichtheimia hyalospora FSU 10163]
MVNVEQLVEEIIKNNKVAVFSKSYCPYCQRAKALLKSLGVEFFVIELDEDSNGGAIQAYLLTRSGQRTVPNIYIKEQHIGGCDELLSANASGRLHQLLLD